MSAVLDLARLGSGGITIQGDAAGDQAGTSVSVVGDFNGDGIADYVVGARLSDIGGADAGAAYLIYGTASGPATIDLTNLTPSQGFALKGVSPTMIGSGSSVASAGDVNGDGFDDLLVGATGHTDAYNISLEAFVVFGRADKPASISLGNLAASDGFSFRSGAGSGYPGSVAAAGDVNGDGFDDIILGAPAENKYGGAAYLIFGKAGGFANIDAAKLGSSGVKISADSSLFAVGQHVAGLGDINGDGFDDIIVSAQAPDGQHFYGSIPRAYVIFGKQSGFANFDLKHLSASDGFTIYGDYAYGSTAFGVAGAGDVNGDGFDDIAVGSPSEDSGAGTAYVIFGKAGGFSDLTLSTLAPSAGFAMHGGAAHAAAGRSVAGAGDLNRDGFDDLIVGAPGGGTDFAGGAYVIFGKPSGFSTLDLSKLSPAQGLVIAGAAASDNAGSSVSGGADLNGDGVPDILIGAPFSDKGGIDAGAAYVLFGTQALVAQIAQDDFNGDGHSDLLWQSEAGLVRDWLGQANGGFTLPVSNLSAAVDPNVWHVAGTGDFNGDGKFDVLWRSGDGTLTWWAGQADGTFDATGLYTSVSADWQVAGVADFNNDGVGDLLLRNGGGSVREWLGHATGGFSDNSATVNIAVPTDWHVVGTGDFNGDGFGDVLWRSDAGLVRDWLGQANGAFAGNVANLNNVAADPHVWSVVGTGDFDGDTLDDILWRSADGTVREWIGQANGGFSATSSTLNAKVDGVWHVVGIGDFNGDKFEDIAWRSEDGTTTDWLGQAGGGFRENSANLWVSQSLDWHVQSPFVHDPMT